MSQKTVWPVLDEAHEALRAVVRGVPDGGWDNPTPCVEWNVTQVLQHAVGDQLAYAAFITGGPGPQEDPFAPSGELAGAPESLVGAAVQAAADAWATVDKNAEEVAVPMPPNKMTAQTGAGACALDAAIHAWDIAVATGQPSPLNAELAGALLPVARTVVIQPLRDYGAFGAALDSAEEDPVAALLHFVDRDPNWTAPDAPSSSS